MQRRRLRQHRQKRLKLRLHLQHHPPLLAESRAQETILLRPARASHAQWLVRLATTHSLPARVLVPVPVARVRLVPVVLVPVRVVQVVRLVPVALRVQVSVAVPPVALRVQVSAAVHQVPVAVLQVLVAHVHPVVRELVAAVTVVEPPVRSVRAVAAVHPRLASRSARNAKSSNREWLRALVAQLCHVATAQPFCGYVAVQASKTLQTRLRPLQLS